MERSRSESSIFPLLIDGRGTSTGPKDLNLAHTVMDRLATGIKTTCHSKVRKPPPLSEPMDSHSLLNS